MKNKKEKKREKKENMTHYDETRGAMSAYQKSTEQKKGDYSPKSRKKLGTVGKIRQVTVIFPPDESCCTLDGRFKSKVTLPFALKPRQSKKFLVTS